MVSLENKGRYTICYQMSNIVNSIMVNGRDKHYSDTNLQVSKARNALLAHMDIYK